MKNNESSLLKNISILYRISQIYMEEKYKDTGIQGGQGPFLFCLYKKEGLSQEEISKWLNMDKGTTAKAIQTLEKNGYVSRELDTTDKRIHRVYLTQKGRDIKPTIMEAVSGWKDEICKNISIEDISTLDRILDSIVENTTQYYKNNLKK